MTLLLIGAVLTGVIFGIFLPAYLAGFFANLTTAALCILLVGIGIDLGRNKNEIYRTLKRLGWRICIIPLSIACGSIVGAVAGGFFLGLPINESAAIGAGFGWYSLSGVLLAKIYNIETGTLAFLTNVTREVLALLVIPFVAKYVSRLASVAPGGATAMDTTLPLIAKFTDSSTAAVAFFCGLVLSMLVPVLVPILINL